MNLHALDLTVTAVESVTLEAKSWLDETVWARTHDEVTFTGHHVALTIQTEVGAYTTGQTVNAAICLIDPEDTTP